MRNAHSSTYFSLGLLLAATIAVVAPPAPAAAQDADVDYQADIVYGKGSGEDLMLDLATPKGLDKPAPTIVFIHGGGWAAGHRNNMTGLAKQAAARGYVAATVSYRFAPKYVFPAQVEDCKCAVRWLRANAAERKIDPTRLGSAGVSAGAHLAMMLGTLDSSDGLEGEGGSSDQSSKVQTVVSFVGPVNLVGEYPDASMRILQNFLGGRPQDKQDECRRASPITYVNSGDAPMLLFYGTKDPLVPYDQAFQMTKALTDAGIPARIELMIGAGHGWIGKDMERSINEMFAFFDRHLKGG
ncbi:MAG: alpha/beta hydrolase [Planctomycetia bacterium]|nr:alpha/beta hydrolase [Planctomycetia bacterium]